MYKFVIIKITKLNQYFYMNKEGDILKIQEILYYK